MDTDRLQEVDRILKARTHFHVLGFEVVEFVVLVDVRRQYKALARQNLNGNDDADAEDAFKKLSLAYECLADERLQNEYLAVTAGSRKRPRPPSEPRPHKKNQKPPTKATRPRTAEEIYAEFLKEEELQAEAEFFKRGFERDYESSSHRKKPLSPPPVHSDEYIEAVLSNELESKQSTWSQFQKNGSVPPTIGKDSTVISTTSTSSKTTSGACCYLCRRKFPTTAHLQRHENVSKLHAENLAKGAKALD